MKESIFYKIFLKRKLQEKNSMKKQDFLLKSLKKKINNEYLLLYIDLIIEIKSTFGREESMSEILAYCLLNNYDTYLEELFKTQTFLDKKRYSKDQKFIVFIYLYYLKIKGVLDKKEEMFKQKCFYKTKIRNLDRDYKKYNKFHHKKIKKIKKHKKKDYDTKNFEIMYENFAIIVESIQGLYMNLIIHRKNNKFMMNELENCSKCLSQNVIMKNKKFYLYEEEIEKITKRIDFWTQIGLIIAIILFVILMFYNLIIVWIK